MKKGTYHSKKTRQKLSKVKIGKYKGIDSPHWKEKIKTICIVCKKELFIIPSKKDKVKYCSRKCQSKAKSGKPTWNTGKKLHYTVWNKGKKCPQFSMEKSSAWKGGKTISPTGYVYIYIPTHPHSRNGYMAEHRLVMEHTLGRFLIPDERVHHINGIKTDNRIENLMYFPNESKHQKYHSSI